MANTPTYRLTGVLFNKADIAGYEVKELGTSETSILTLTEIQDLALKNQISGCELVTDDQGMAHILSLETDITKLPLVYKKKAFKHNELMVTQKLLSSGTLYGYVFIDGKGISHNYSLDNSWELANRGMVRNMSAKISNGAKVLEGADGCLLYALPIITKPGTKE